MLLGYFGPETVLPLGSAIAAVLGVFLMFGRQVVFMTRRALARIARLFHRGMRPKAGGATPAHGGSVRYDEAAGTHSPHAPVTSEDRVPQAPAAKRDSSA